MKDLNQEKIEKNIEIIMGNLLRVGVLLSASIVLLGGVLYLLQYGSTIPNYGVFHGEPTKFRHVTNIISDAFSFHKLGLIQFGIILLIATPIARVIFSVVAFLYEKDFLYVGFTLLVLGVLLYSLWAG